MLFDEVWKEDLLHGLYAAVEDYKEAVLELVEICEAGLLGLGVIDAVGGLEVIEDGVCEEGGGSVGGNDERGSVVVVVVREGECECRVWRWMVLFLLILLIRIIHIFTNT